MFRLSRGGKRAKRACFAKWSVALVHKGEGVLGSAVAIALVGLGELIATQHKPNAQRVEDKRYADGLDDGGHLGIVQVIPAKVLRERGG